MLGPLLTDFYQITMAYGYWKTGRMDQTAVFSLYFRTNPFHGGYALLAGLHQIIDFIYSFSFKGDELDFLRRMKNRAGQPLFEPEFIEFLRASTFQCDVEAIPEGTVVFPMEPVLKVRGPIWQCQWVETALLTHMNFQTLIATKAARIVHAARGEDVLEFGLRRAQGPDGALSASRAAYIGGTAATSNVLAAFRFGIPLRGTHAHSWIMAFPTEEEAFDRYAEALPDDCVLLVDTYNTLNGVRNAIKTGRKLAEEGKELRGVRLDSGDFAYLSQQARQLLDEAGLTRTQIVASNELDENLIQSLHIQDAKITSWGVGTKLVTGDSQPAMNGVYKLAAVYDREHSTWSYKIKISDQPAKTSNPGIQRVRRYFNTDGKIEGDLIYDESETGASYEKIFDPVLPHRAKRIHREWQSEELLRPIFSNGKCVYSTPSLLEIRERARKQLAQLHPGHLRLENPHTYPVGLSPYLTKLKEDLIRRWERE